MKKLALTSAIALIVGGLSTNVAAAGRDTISIVGSSTVYPFATVVAERFGKTGGKTPTIESTGTGGGMKLFCAGVGIDTPDITNASRRMKKSEFEDCVKNGVTDVTEVLIGYDGIVIANSKSASRLQLTRKELFMALAKDVPAADGSNKVVPNTAKTWKDVNPALPADKIEVLGPPPTSGTRDAFTELVMEEGCSSFDWIKAMAKEDKKTFKSICHSVREDGAYIEAGENDNLIVQKLEANPKALGIFGFSFLDQNADKVQGSIVDGSEPKFETIASGEYPVSRPLYFYVKKAHVGQVPGIAEFVKEFTSEAAFGNSGYLLDKGLIPLADDKRKEIQDAANSMKKLEM
jgi:phosphate transport system substrate-binding protein